MKPKGRAAPPASVDHAVNLRDRLGKVAYEAAFDHEPVAWAETEEPRRERYRKIGDAVLAAISGHGSGERGDFAVSSIYGYATQKPYVNIEVSISPMQASPAKAREMALMLLESADAAESDAVLIGYALDALGLDTSGAAQLLNQFRSYRAKKLGKAAQSA